MTLKPPHRLTAVSSVPYRLKNAVGKIRTVGALNPLPWYISVINFVSFPSWVLFCSNPYMKIDTKVTAHSDRALDRRETAWAPVLDTEVKI
jgi:hypothetical protein